MLVYGSPRGLGRHDITVRWSRDGAAAVVVLRKEPYAFVEVGRPLGYSKALAVPSEVGSPWDQARFQEHFESKP